MTLLKGLTALGLAPQGKGSQAATASEQRVSSPGAADAGAVEFEDDVVDGRNGEGVVLKGSQDHRGRQDVGLGESLPAVFSPYFVVGLVGTVAGILLRCLQSRYSNPE